MKINRKVFLAVILILLVISIDVLFASGDVGNAFSGSVSSGGNDSSGGGFILWYILFFVPYPYNIILYMLIIFAGVFGKKKNRNMQVSRVSNFDLNVQFNEDQVISKIKQNDTNFSKYAFLTYARQVLIVLQEAMEDSDLSVATPFLEPNFANLINEAILGDSTFYYQGQEILNASYKEFRSDDTYNYITLELFVSEYYYEKKNNKIMFGSEKKRVNNVYELVFKRKSSILTNGNANMQTTNCPSCGAPNKIRNSGECEYCNNIVNTGEFSFVLSDMKNINEKDSIYYKKFHTRHLRGLNNENEVVEQVKVLDSEFKLVPFENFVSESFLNVQEAWAKRDINQIQCYESSDLFNIHRTQIQEYIDSDLYPFIKEQKINDVHLNRFEMDGKHQYLTVVLDCNLKVYVKDKDGNIISGNDKMERKNGYLLRYKRSSSAITKEHESSSFCPNCGASVSINGFGSCSYCDSGIVNGQHGWVMDSYEAINRV